MEQHTETDIRPQRWSTLATSRRMAAAVGVTGALLLAGIGVAAAQTDDPPTTPRTPPADESARPGGVGKMRGGPGGPAGRKAMRGAVHGEFVTRHGDGFRTMATQTGTVTAVSETSITVKSADDYTKTYAVDANTVVNAGRDGIDSVKQGDTVDVHAVVDGDTYRAMRIEDVTANAAIRKHWNPDAPEPPGRG
ncbi:MAG: hypothetical protein KY443_03445 [Actinobacteria bacterium]|nr:hypothetical protein [Actinomycetota bacterium]